MKDNCRKGILYMNEVLQLLHNHRTIRKFKQQEVETEKIRTIVEAGQRASTSSYVMAYSIIGITDEAIKGEFYKITGQRHVKDNGYLFVICADLNRNNTIATTEIEENKTINMESTEQFIVATTDAALVAQNMVVATESLGLGACFIGSLRNDINRVDELLALPDYVVPLYGLAIGYPDHQPEVKPRLPFEAVFHENKYDATNKIKHIEEFDESIRTYYQERSTNQRIDTWTEQMGRKYAVPTRLDVGSYIAKKKLNKHEK